MGACHQPSLGRDLDVCGLDNAHLVLIRQSCVSEVCRGPGGPHDTGAGDQKANSHAPT